MSDAATMDAYGQLVEPTTLKIQRVLPGPIERVWDYLTQSDLRKQWFASGDMKLEAGAPFTLTWRNEELNTPKGKRPEGAAEEHSSTNTIIAVDPPKKLVITFGQMGEVSFDLETRGDKVLLTLVHSRIPDRSTLLGVSGGWHGHLDILVAKLSGGAVPDFWTNIAKLRPEYEARFPG
jgi:uncharacterized protein YndB with AHSA1/START domain